MRKRGTFVGIQTVLLSTKEIVDMLQTYHAHPEGEEPFTQLMFELLKFARSKNSKIVKTYLNKLQPHGKYKIETLSDTEIHTISRQMYADRKFMKHNTLSIASWLMVIITGGIILFTSTFMLLAPRLQPYFKNIDDQVKFLTIVFMTGLGTQLATTGLKEGVKNIYQLKCIVNMCKQAHGNL